MALSEREWSIIEKCAMAKWGLCYNWPRPSSRKPKWWQFRRRRYEAEFEAVFGPLTDAARVRYWQQSQLGQSVYEDAGGYIIRRFRAMCDAPFEQPVSYSDFIRAALEGSTPR